MKTMLKYTLGILALLQLTGCAGDARPETSRSETSEQAPVNPMDELTWLLGKWMQPEGEGKVSYEQWQRTVDGNYLGMACTLVGEDTVWQEEVHLFRESGEVFYKVHQDKNPGPVSFKLVRSENGQATFENPQHDYPTQIFYQRTSDSTLFARIGGMVQGQPVARDFPMVRVK